MCDFCEENGGEYESCQQCRVSICFDVRGGDDGLRGACASEDGDLYCFHCAVRIDEEQERELADEFYEQDLE